MVSVRSPLSSVPQSRIVAQPSRRAPMASSDTGIFARSTETRQKTISKASRTAAIRKTVRRTRCFFRPEGRAARPELGAVLRLAASAPDAVSPTDSAGETASGAGYAAEASSPRRSWLNTVPALWARCRSWACRMASTL